MKSVFQSIMGVIAVTLLVLHLLSVAPFLFTLIFLRFILPANVSRKTVNPLIVSLCSYWVFGILAWMRHVQRLEWDIECDVALSKEQWYMVVANHQSWVDIFALFHVMLYQAPMPKFFIKKQLAWVPIAGQAWWALDYPFMSRRSREYIQKHPEKANEDLLATRKSCEKFSTMPTTVVNFLEGTRFTQQKYLKQNSPYKHLLKPKAGGIAFAIQALGARFDTMIDVTIHYTGAAPNYWDMACGRTGKITMRLRKVDIPAEYITMDYTYNAEHKAKFQQWLHEIWLHKDQQMALIDAQIKAQTEPKTESKTELKTKVQAGENN